MYILLNISEIVNSCNGLVDKAMQSCLGDSVIDPCPGMLYHIFSHFIFHEKIIFVKFLEHKEVSGFCLSKLK